MKTWTVSPSLPERPCGHQSLVLSKETLKVPLVLRPTELDPEEEHLYSH